MRKLFDKLTEKQKYDRLEQNACSRCGRPLKDGEPVVRREFRFGAGPEGRWLRKPWGSECLPCVAARKRLAKYPWQRPGAAEESHHCPVCERQVLAEVRFDAPMLPSNGCTNYCQRILNARTAAVKRHEMRRLEWNEKRGWVPKKWRCKGCRKPFDPTVRADQEYCNVACKQRAYRKRHKKGGARAKRRRRA